MAFSAHASPADAGFAKAGARFPPSCTHRGPRGRLVRDQALKHPIVVGSLFRNVLHHVPVLDDLAVLKPENVDNSAAARAGITYAMDVQDHVAPSANTRLISLLALGARSLMKARKP